MKSVGTGKKGEKKQQKIQNRDHPALQLYSHDRSCLKQGKKILLIFVPVKPRIKQNKRIPWESPVKGLQVFSTADLASNSQLKSILHLAKT